MSERLTGMAILCLMPGRLTARPRAPGGPAPGAFPSLRRSPGLGLGLRVHRFQVADPQQIERCQAEDEHPAHPRCAPMARLPQGSDGLHPSKHLFNELALALTKLVALWRVVRPSIALRRFLSF